MKEKYNYVGHNSSKMVPVKTDRPKPILKHNQKQKSRLNLDLEGLTITPENRDTTLDPEQL